MDALPFVPPAAPAADGFAPDFGLVPAGERPAAPLLADGFPALVVFFTVESEPRGFRVAGRVVDLAPLPEPTAVVFCFFSVVVPAVFLEVVVAAAGFSAWVEGDLAAAAVPPRAARVFEALALVAFALLPDPGAEEGFLFAAADPAVFLDGVFTIEVFSALSGAGILAVLVPLRAARVFVAGVRLVFRAGEPPSPSPLCTRPFFTQSDSPSIKGVTATTLSPDFKARISLAAEERLPAWI